MELILGPLILLPPATGLALYILEKPMAAFRGTGRVEPAPSVITPSAT